MKWLTNLWASITGFFKRLFGIKSSPSTTPPPAAVWSFMYSPGMDGPAANPFAFPATDGVHYLVQGHSGPLRTGLYLRARIDAQEGTEFSAATGTAASGGVPMVTLYFQKRGDDLTNPNGRWWYWARSILQNGELIIDAPLSDPSAWTQVYGVKGREVPVAFQEAITDVQTVGMTFGGDFYGHGAFAPHGSATFTILEWRAI